MIKICIRCEEFRAKYMSNGSNPKVVFAHVSRTHAERFAG